MNPVIIDYFKDMKIDKIGCGYWHSFCGTMDGKYYLFGKNKDNECITDDGRKYVDVPNCIDQVIKQKTNGMEIRSITLGCDTTIIIVESESESDCV